MSIYISTIKPEIHSRTYWWLSDTWVLIRRSLMHITKNIDQLLGVAFQPIMFMLLFRYVFGGAIATGGLTYVNFLVAGILVQTLAFGSLTTAMSVATDMQRGIIDRIKSLPVAGTGLLFGHIIADLARNLLSSVIMITVGLLVGFRPEASFLQWLGIFGLVLLFTFTMSWVAAILGLLAKSIEAVQWMGFVIIFPLTFASGAFVPTVTMPKYLRLFAENQPITQVIEAVRGLMNGEAIGSRPLVILIWAVCVLAVCIPLASYLFRQNTGK